MEAFRTQKETIKATYTAAEAQTRINEAFSGISEEMGDVGMAIQRAEDKTAQMQARAGAIDELMASGRAGRRDSGTQRDDIQAELDRMRGGQRRGAASWQRLKGELAGARPAGDRGRPGHSAAQASPASPAEQPQAGESHDRPDPGRGPARARRRGHGRAERAGRRAGGGGRTPATSEAFRPALAALLDRVRAARQRRCRTDALEPSDLILPTEARPARTSGELLTGEG